MYDRDLDEAKSRFLAFRAIKFSSLSSQSIDRVSSLVLF